MKAVIQNNSISITVTKFFLQKGLFVLMLETQKHFKCNCFANLRNCGSYKETLFNVLKISYYIEVVGVILWHRAYGMRHMVERSWIQSLLKNIMNLKDKLLYY
jgi:hypothetical protein